MNGPRIASIVLVALLMIGALFLLVQAGRFVFGSIGGDSSDNSLPSTTVEDGGASSETTTDQTTLQDYIDSEASAILIKDGEITDREEHYRIEIEVTPTERELRVVQGYANNVILRKQFKNTFSAYEAFMSAVNFEGILETKEAAYPSVDGVCPTGERHIYKIDVSGVDDDLESWSSTCSSRHGSFAGDRAGVRKLFEKQIPEYRDLTQEFRL